MFFKQEVVYVRQSEFGRVAGIDGTAFGPHAEHFFAGEIRIYDIPGPNSQALKVDIEERGVHEHTQDSRHADTDLLPFLHYFPAAHVPGCRSRDFLGRVHFPYFSSGIFHKIWICVACRIQLFLNSLHRAHVFNAPFFAGCHYEPPSAIAISRADVYERAEAVVFAEMTARLFAHGGPVLDMPYGIQTDEGGLPALLPQGHSLERAADRARFSGVFMYDDLRRLAGSLKSLLDEIHLSFHGREIVLRAALKNEAGPQFRQVGNLGDVKPDILGQHGREAGEISFGCHPWLWKLAISDCRNTAHP